MSPLLKHVSLITFIICMLMISCSAFAGYIWLEDSVITDTNVNMLGNSVRGDVTPFELNHNLWAKRRAVKWKSDWTGDSHIITLSLSDTELIMIDESYEIMTCEEAKKRATTLGINSKYMCVTH